MNGLPLVALLVDAVAAGVPIPPLEIGVQAIQLSPDHAGLAGQHVQRLPVIPAFRACSCPLRLSPSGKPDDPETSLRVSPDCVRDSAPRSAAHRFRASGSPDPGSTWCMVLALPQCVKPEQGRTTHPSNPFRVEALCPAPLRLMPTTGTLSPWALRPVGDPVVVCLVRSTLRASVRPLPRRIAGCVLPEDHGGEAQTPVRQESGFQRLSRG